MSEEPRVRVSPVYAVGQLERALRQAVTASDPAARRRAEQKAARWREVITGIAEGRLTVGSRTPVADTPAWVTLEVAHGGFATGRYLAESVSQDAMTDTEAARVGALPADAPGSTDRERLNLWYLSDQGQAELLAALGTERYRIEVPEESSLLIVAWLLENGQFEAALDLVAELRPWMHRLRFTPATLGKAAAARPAGAVVRLASVGEVKQSLRAVRTPAAIAVMLETLRVWHPLYDRLVALWCDTVDGELPHLTDHTANGGHGRRDLRVVGGWPCRIWPADWTLRRGRLLADYQQACTKYPLAAGHKDPKGNFARLWAALEACPTDSSGLSGRDVGWVRRALANTITKHGAPRSEQRAALRSIQATITARPTYATLAQVLGGRLDRYPEDGGLPSLDPIEAPTEAPTDADVSTTDALTTSTTPTTPATPATPATPDMLGGARVPAGTPIPSHLVAKAARALEAPIAELVDRRVITSGEVLARVLPQVTSQLLAADIADPALAIVYAHAYAAFRRRRSLLLLNLEHQIRFDELPWIAALAPARSHPDRPGGRDDKTDKPGKPGHTRDHKRDHERDHKRDQERAEVARAAHLTLRQTTLLAFSAFPQAILPNPLVREMGALAQQAGLRMPLVEEVAADIFMGTFTAKWRDAAAIASTVMDGSLYARYYDLPAPGAWSAPAGGDGDRGARRGGWVTRRWGKQTADDFARVCQARAVEARVAPDMSLEPGFGFGYVAANGAVLEQSQILTTHNLAALIDSLDLRDTIRDLAQPLADKAFTWIVRRLGQPAQDQHAALQMIKNVAYAWRQAVFLISWCDNHAQRESITKLRTDVVAAHLPRFTPAVTGLEQLLAGGRFNASGRIHHGTGDTGGTDDSSNSDGPGCSAGPSGHTGPSRPNLP